MTIKEIGFAIWFLFCLAGLAAMVVVVAHFVAKYW